MVRVHYTADPTMTPERVKELRKSYTSKARWEREMEIAYEALEGERFYPEFKREVNVCESFDVSDTNEWTIWNACDPHPRTPHAFIWRAFNRYGDHVVCGELWPEGEEGLTVKDYADAVEFLEGDSEDKPYPFEWARGKKLKIYQRYMDTFGKGADSDEGVNFFRSYAKHGLYFQPATKGQGPLDAAHDEIGRQLLPVQITIGDQVIQRPQMRVFEFCYETIREFERVRYPEGEPLRPADEKPVTYRKHCLDGIHYIETARPRYVAPKRSQSTFEPINPDTAY